MSEEEGAPEKELVAGKGKTRLQVEAGGVHPGQLGAQHGVKQGGTGARAVLPSAADVV